MALFSLLTTQRVTFTHTFIHRWGRLPYRVPTCLSEGANLSHTHQEQFGLVNMWTGEAGNYTANLWISGRYTLPPEPQTFFYTFFTQFKFFCLHIRILILVCSQRRPRL